jgi:hypothetical protein
MEQERKLMQQRLQEREAAAAKAKAAAAAAAEEEARRQRQILQAEAHPKGRSRTTKTNAGGKGRATNDFDKRRNKNERFKKKLGKETRKKHCVPVSELRNNECSTPTYRTKAAAAAAATTTTSTKSGFLQYPTHPQHQLMHPHQYQVYAPNTPVVPLGATGPAATMMPPFHLAPYAPHFYHPAPSNSALSQGNPAGRGQTP